LSNEKYAKIPDINDMIRLVYNIAFKILENQSGFFVIFEENDNSIYFTIKNAYICKDKFGSCYHILQDEYSNIEFKSKENLISCRLIKEKAEQLPNTEDITKDNPDKISAKEYLASVAINLHTKLELLEEYEDIIDKYFYWLELGFNITYLHNAAQEIIRYSRIVEKFIDFPNMAIAIWSIGEFLLEIKEEDFKDDSQKALVTEILKAILTDIQEWRISIFVAQTQDDIYFLDDSLISSFKQIKAILEDKSESSSSESSEDIFFF
jgi:hypothetical protein